MANCCYVPVLQIVQLYTVATVVLAGILVKPRISIGYCGISPVRKI